jgi:hypothetical protein
MDSDFKYGTDGLTYEEHVKRYGKKNDINHDKRMSGELPRLDRKPKKGYRGGRPVGPINHGTIYGYKKRHCRCSDCTQAYHVFEKERYKARTLEMHGILSWAIKTKCDCPKCMEVIEKMNIENEKRNKGQ